MARAVPVSSLVKGDAKVEYLPGLVCTGHYFDVPLDYGQPDGTKIKVFAREVVSSSNAERLDLPFLLFLQGGPGFESPRPEGSSGWLKRALRDYRVLLLDQRGTGLSTVATHQTLTAFPDAQAQFEYLKHFRADDIVRDCEFIRKSLGAGKAWTILGQSYGGFCATTYLSQAPEGLKGVLITGGLPPLATPIDDVYRAIYRQAIKRNKLFYERFPSDGLMVQKIVRHLRAKKVTMPSGETLTPALFKQLGLAFGMSGAGASMNTIHYLLENPFVESAKEETLSYSFLSAVEKRQVFNSNPIYALLHEAIYCEGQASLWSAERIAAEFSEFADDSELPFFTTEMIYPLMFDEYVNLRPLKELSEKLAAYSNWKPLYDIDTLKKNTVQTAACIYYSDIYVDRSYSEKTADIIRGAKIWVTNEYGHDGLRQDGEKILDRLLEMLKENYR